MPGPSVDVDRHLDESELSAAIDEAQMADRARLVRRLCFIRNLYEGDSVSEAAARVGVSQPTGSRWVDAWNADGVAGLGPNFGGGRPPKLDETQREQLGHLLQRHQPRTIHQVERLLEAGFGVTYSYRHLRRLLNSLEQQYSFPRPERIDRTDVRDDGFEDALRAMLAELDDTVLSDDTDDSVGTDRSSD